MQLDEFKFMMDKLSVSLASTLQIKKTLFLEIVKSSESQVAFTCDKLNRDEFVSFMLVAFSELVKTLSDVVDHVQTLSLAVN
jgi:hypothetical protein